MAKYRQAGLKKIEWSVGPEDGRECAVCAARGGKVYLIDEAPIIPAHPRCRCIYAGVVELSNEDVEVDGPAADAALEAAQQQKKLQKTDSDAKMNLQLFAFKSSDFKTVHLPKDEYAMVMHEINTHLTAEEQKQKVVTKMIGDYVYYFENHGFNNYRIFDKILIDEIGWDDE